MFDKVIRLLSDVLCVADKKASDELGEALSVLHEYPNIKAEIAELKERVSQLDVQLAGCSVAAFGLYRSKPAKQGDYGWSPAYQDVMDLRQKYEELLRWQPLIEKAKGVEWKPDDPKTTALSRFDEAVREVLVEANEFRNDWIWQERKKAVEIARSLIESIPKEK